MRSALHNKALWCLLALAVFSLACSLVARGAADRSTPGAQATPSPGIDTATPHAGAPTAPQSVATVAVPMIQTQVITSPGQVPADIPIMEGEKSAYVGSAQAVSYFIGAGFDAVLDFYQHEMEAQGWNKVDYGTALTKTYAELHYEKAGRKAVVVITEVPFVNRTTVVITLE